MTQINLQLEPERQISDMKPTCEYKILALIILRHKWNSSVPGCCSSHINKLWKNCCTRS